MGSSGSKEEVNREPSTERTLSVNKTTMHTYNDEAFKRIREHCAVQDDFLNEGFDFRLKVDGGKMAEGGGKGGNLMGFTDSRMFIVKELNDTDHNTLLLYADQYADQPGAAAQLHGDEQCHP